MTDRPANGPVGAASAWVTSLSLLERARASDGDAWSRVVSLYEPLVRQWCYRAGLRASEPDTLGDAGIELPERLAAPGVPRQVPWPRARIHEARPAEHVVRDTHDALR